MTLFLCFIGFHGVSLRRRRNFFFLTLEKVLGFCALLPQAKLFFNASNIFCFLAFRRRRKKISTLQRDLTSSLWFFFEEMGLGFVLCFRRVNWGHRLSITFACISFGGGHTKVADCFSKKIVVLGGQRCQLILPEKGSWQQGSSVCPPPTPPQHMVRCR